MIQSLNELEFFRPQIKETQLKIIQFGKGNVVAPITLKFSGGFLEAHIVMKSDIMARAQAAF